MSAAPAPLGDGRRGRFAGLVALAFGQAAAMAAAAVATRAVFSAMHEGLSPLGPALALAAAALALALCRWGGRWAAAGLGQDYAAAVRLAVFRQLSRMPAEAVAARRSGGLTLRFTGDLAALSGWVSRGLAPLLAAAVALPAAFAALVWVSPAAAAGAAPGLLIGLGAMALFGAGLGRRHRRLRSRRARLATEMAERLPLAPELRLAGRMATETARLESRGRALRRAAALRARDAAALAAAPDAIAGLAALGAILAVFRAGEGPAALAGALAALGLMLTQLRDLAGVWDRRRAHEAARARLDALLSAPRLARPSAARVRKGRPALAFEGVSAGPVTGFDAALAPGEKAALTGPNGAGKSALLRVAAGLDAPEAGRVRVRGAAPASLSVADRRRQILHIGPRPLILAGSLRRALSLGLSPRPDDAALIAAAERAGFDGALSRLGGLDGQVGEGGRTLSAGELARLALARLILSDARLALIDGLDAALDEAGREALLEAVVARKGAVLIACRDEGFAARVGAVWRLPAPPEARAA